MTGKHIILVLAKQSQKETLLKTNERRNYKIFEEYAYHLIDLACKKLVYDDFEIEGKVYAFDYLAIDMCLSVFCG